MKPTDTNQPIKKNAAAPKASFIQAADNAYNSIKEKIISNELKPGTILKEIDLAEKLGLSRTPVREAMKQLKHEGLITLESYNRNVVAVFSDKDIIEIYGIRAVLEGYATSLAAQNITNDDLDEMKRIQDEMDNLILTDLDPGTMQQGFKNLNSEFHKTIWKASKNARIEKLLESSLEIPINVPESFFSSRQKIFETSSWQHREIINALEARNPVWAESQMRAHTLSVVGIAKEIRL